MIKTLKPSEEIILEAAREDGLLYRKLTKNEEKSLNPCVVTTNKILRLADNKTEVFVKQLSYQLQIEEDACLAYCGWLAQKEVLVIKMVKRSVGGGYFSVKSLQRLKLRNI